MRPVEFQRRGLFALAPRRKRPFLREIYKTYSADWPRVLKVMQTHPHLIANQSLKTLGRFFSVIRWIHHNLKNVPPNKLITDVPEFYQKINQEALDALLIGTVCTHPTDGKGDNYMVELTWGENSLESATIISIDNDLSLGQSSFSQCSNEDQQETDFTLNEKSILYCLPLALLGRPLHPRIRDHLLSRSAEQWLMVWLTQLAQFDNAIYDAKRQEFIHEQEFNNYFPIKLSRDAIFRLYERLGKILENLGEKPESSFLDLMQAAAPALHGSYWSAGINQHLPHPRARLDFLCPTELPSPLHPGCFLSTKMEEGLFNKLTEDLKHSSNLYAEAEVLRISARQLLTSWSDLPHPIRIQNEAKACLNLLSIGSSTQGSPPASYPFSGELLQAIEELNILEIRRLILLGASPNAATPTGNTCFHLLGKKLGETNADRAKVLVLIEFLLEVKDARSNAVNQSGEGFLHLLSTIDFPDSNQAIRLFQKLRNAGFNLDIRNPNTMKTPLDQAIEIGNWGVFRALTTAGAGHLLHNQSVEALALIWDEDTFKIEVETLFTLCPTLQQRMGISRACLAEPADFAIIDSSTGRSYGHLLLPLDLEKDKWHCLTDENFGEAYITIDPSLGAFAMAEQLFSQAVFGNRSFLPLLFVQDHIGYGIYRPQPLTPGPRDPSELFDQFQHLQPTEIGMLTILSLLLGRSDDSLESYCFEGSGETSRLHIRNLTPWHSQQLENRTILPNWLFCLPHFTQLIDQKISEQIIAIDPHKTIEYFIELHAYSLNRSKAAPLNDLLKEIIPTLYDRLASLCFLVRSNTSITPLALLSYFYPQSGVIYGSLHDTDFHPASRFRKIRQLAKDQSNTAGPLVPTDPPGVPLDQILAQVGDHQKKIDHALANLMVGEARDYFALGTQKDRFILIRRLQGANTVLSASTLKLLEQDLLEAGFFSPALFFGRTFIGNIRSFYAVRLPSLTSKHLQTIATQAPFLDLLVLDESSIQSIANFAMANLRSLSARFCRKLSNIHFTAPKLKQLDLTGCINLLGRGTLRQRFQFLSGTSSIEEKRFKLFQELWEEACSSRISYGGNSQQVARLLERVPALIKLNLNYFHPRIISYLYFVLDTPSQVLSFARFPKDSTTYRNILSLLYTVSSNPNIKVLSLEGSLYSKRENLWYVSGSGIADWQRGLIEGLRTNMTLEVLILADLDITDGVVKELAEVLKKHPTIKALDLSYNLVSENGAQSILDLIKENKRIGACRLTNNGIQRTITSATFNLIKEQLSINRTTNVSNTDWTSWQSWTDEKLTQFPNREEVILRTELLWNSILAGRDPLLLSQEELEEAIKSGEDVWKGVPIEYIRKELKRRTSVHSSTETTNSAFYRILKGKEVAIPSSEEKKIHSQFSQTNRSDLNENYRLAKELQGLKQYEEAVAYAKIAVQEGENSAVSLLAGLLAYRKYEILKIDEAIRVYEEAIGQSFLDVIDQSFPDFRKLRAPENSIIPRQTLRWMSNLADLYQLQNIRPERTFLLFYIAGGFPHPDAVFGLGTCYELGVGIDANQEVADSLYRSALIFSFKEGLEKGYLFYDNPEKNRIAHRIAGIDLKEKGADL